jgi:hypothetical protein
MPVDAGGGLDQGHQRLLCRVWRVGGNPGGRRFRCAGCAPFPHEAQQVPCRDAGASAGPVEGEEAVPDCLGIDVPAGQGGADQGRANPRRRRDSCRTARNPPASGIPMRRAGQRRKTSPGDGPPAARRCQSASHRWCGSRRARGSGCTRFETPGWSGRSRRPDPRRFRRRPVNGSAANGDRGRRNDRSAHGSPRSRHHDRRG